MKASTLTLDMMVHMFTVDVWSSSGHWILEITKVLMKNYLKLEVLIEVTTFQLTFSPAAISIV